jgi:ABC-2 type transport system permease protein
MINPLATALILAAVFGTIFRVDPPVGDPSGLHGFTFYLLAALLPWNMFTSCLNNSMGVVINNAGLIQKVNFRRSSLVWSTCASAAITLLIELAVLVALIWVLGDAGPPLHSWVAVPVVAALGLFGAGLGMMLATANVYFRDVAYLIGIVLTAWFYLTPIVYTIDLVPESAQVLGVEVNLRTVIEWNPMSRFSTAMRDVMYHDRFPTAVTWCWVAGLAAGALALGSALFRRFEPRFAEEL